MEALRIEHGATFLTGATHPTISPGEIAQSMLEDPAVRAALQGARWRLLHVSPHYAFDRVTGRRYSPGGEAVFYDYTRNRTLYVRKAGMDAPEVEWSTEQPVPSMDEWREAVEAVRRSPVWGPLLDAGVTPYRTMPPMLESEGGEAVERTVFVGMLSRERRFNQVAAVKMATGEVSRTAVVPPRSRAAASVCGLPAVYCNRPYRGTPGGVTIEWPTDSPVWRFHATRPTASSGTNASGIELHEVTYRGVRVLKQAHLPILNVQYDDNLCGPYRDWLWEETCFQAIGRDIPGAPGFRWCEQPPQTIIERHSDAGNFVGVAVYPTPDGGLGLLSELAAGWYRYVLEWRFYPDGRIEPRVRFGDTDNSCVCTGHNHHAYWRLDFDVVHPKNSLLENAGTEWQPVPLETSRRRGAGKTLLWRVIDPRSGAGYDVIPGPADGVGDAFSGDDLYALRWRPKQIDDGRRKVSLGAQANVAAFVAGESIVAADLVIWYAAHFRHTVDEDGDPHAPGIGPTLQPVRWPK